MKKFIKNYWVLILAFIISTLMNIPHLVPSYFLDGYCSLCEGFNNYALTFVKGGRFATAAIYFIVDLINLNPDIFSTISIILSNLILSITLFIIYKDIKTLINKDSIINKLIIFSGAFLICFNPFNIEYYIFEESFAICAGVLLTILAGSIYAKNQKYNFLKSLLILFLATTFYQGTLCLFIPYVFLLTTLKNKDKNIVENIKENYKFYLKGLVCYGCSLVLSFILLKAVIYIFGLNSQKFGELNILTNIRNIGNLISNTFKNLFNIINHNYYYSLLSSIIIIYLGFLITNFKNNYSKIIYLLLMIIICVITAFIPNLAMNSLENYTAARMTTSIGAINGFLVLMVFIFNENKHIIEYIKKLISIISVILIVIYSLTYLSSAKDNLNRYKSDIKYFSNIIKVINKYEEENTEIKTINFAVGNYVFLYYKTPHNSLNIRANAVEWAIECMFKNELNKNVTTRVVPEYELWQYLMTEETNFKYTFDGDTMYLILL